MKNNKSTTIIGAVVLFLMGLFMYHFMTSRNPLMKRNKSIPFPVETKTESINESLKNQLNLYLNSPAPYEKEKRIERENDVLINLNIEIENKVQPDVFISTFEKTGANRKCSWIQNDTLECRSKVDYGKGWILTLKSRDKKNLKLEKVSWDNVD